ncbi:MAG: hypothetical protein V1898_04225 [Patescibacteria group bacterium]
MSIPKNFSKLSPFLQQESLQKLIGKCPLCGFQYKTIRAKVIEENEDAQLIYIKCQKCNGSIIIFVVSSGPLISSVGLITDLNEFDIVSFKNKRVLKEEDILKLHQNLQTGEFINSIKNYNINNN